MQTKSVDPRVRPNRKALGPPLLSCLSGRTQGSTVFVCHDGGATANMRTMVNLKSASFVVNMLIDKGLTNIQSQIKPQLLFGESFTSNVQY